MSLPLWERGLKFSLILLILRDEASLPLWERGLKLTFLSEEEHEYMSLPLWERGLKFSLLLLILRDEASLPLWERGLKYLSFCDKIALTCRSPCGSVD